MVFHAVKELSEISKLQKIPRDIRRKAREHIAHLFVNGFSPGEIEFLTGARWKRGTIAKYCKELEVQDTSEKENALALMKEFILINGNWNELEFYVKTKNNLNSENLGLTEIVEFKNDIEFKGINIPILVEVLNQLNKRDIQWEVFLDHIKVSIDLIKLGYNLPLLIDLKQKTEKQGGLEEFLKTVVYKIKENEFKEMQKEFEDFWEVLKQDADKEDRRLEEIKHEAMIMRTYVTFAKKLLEEFKFDPLALQTILVLAEKYGEPDSVFKALNSYGSLNRLGEEINYLRTARTEEEAILKECKRLRVFTENYIQELNQEIGAIQERQRQSRILQDIASLLDDPTESKLAAKRFLIISFHLLNSIRDYAYSHN